MKQAAQQTLRRVASRRAPAALVAQPLERPTARRPIRSAAAAAAPSPAGHRAFSAAAYRQQQQQQQKPEQESKADGKEGDAKGTEEQQQEQNKKKQQQEENDTTVEGRSPFAAFVEVLRDEVRKNREWQDSVKQLGGEVSKVQDSEAMQRAKAMYERARVSCRARIDRDGDRTLITRHHAVDGEYQGEPALGSSCRGAAQGRNRLERRRQSRPQGYGRDRICPDCESRPRPGFHPCQAGNL